MYVALGSCVTSIAMSTGDAQLDERGGPFELGNQVLISSHRKLFAVKSRDGERCGKARTRFRRARSREASASKPLQKCRKAIWGDVRTGGRFFRDQLGRCLSRSERRPACRRREARPGRHMERESLCSVAAMASGSNREGESTAAERRVRAARRCRRPCNGAGANGLRCSAFH